MSTVEPCDATLQDVERMQVALEKLETAKRLLGAKMFVDESRCIRPVISIEELKSMRDTVFSLQYKVAYWKDCVLREMRRERDVH